MEALLQQLLINILVALAELAVFWLVAQFRHALAS